MPEVYKLEFYVPETESNKVKNAVFAAGAGTIGNYDCCCWTTAGNGQFRPLPGSNPAIGSINKIENIKEIKVELICEKSKIKKVLETLKNNHPYETPAYQYWKVNI